MIDDALSVQLDLGKNSFNLNRKNIDHLIYIFSPIAKGPTEKCLYN